MRRAAEYKRENVCLGKNSTDYVIKISEFLSPDFIISIILAFCKYISLVTQFKLPLALIESYKSDMEEAY